MDLPEHDETAAVGPDEALLQFRSENVEHLVTPISQDDALPKGKTDDRAERRPAGERAATTRDVARRGSVFLVSAGSFAFGVATGAAVVWLSGPSASSAAAARTAAPQLVASEHPVEQVHTRGAVCSRFCCGATARSSASSIACTAPVAVHRHDIISRFAHRLLPTVRSVRVSERTPCRNDTVGAEESARRIPRGTNRVGRVRGMDICSSGGDEHVDQCAC